MFCRETCAWSSKIKVKKEKERKRVDLDHVAIGACMGKQEIQAERADDATVVYTGMHWHMLRGLSSDYRNPS
jgi:hypothetical protein